MNLADVSAIALTVPPTLVQRRAERIAEDNAQQQAQWEQGQVNGLPARWAARLLREHAALRSQGLPQANRWLIERVERINALFQRCQLPPNATDHDVCDKADEWAKRYARIAERSKTTVQARRQLEDFLCKYGFDLPDAKTGDDAAIRRMLDPVFLRRCMKKSHMRALEQCARLLGYVHRHAGVYVSDETFRRHQQQKRRNKATLEGLDLVCEDTGEILPLDQMHDHSLSNPALRRGELMTRIKGVQKCADELGFASAFVVVTAPGRMHARYAESGDEVPHYDGSTPGEVQAYLCNLWQCFRTWAKRNNLVFMALRTAEPNHDGTPHWNVLLFASPSSLPRLIDKLRELAMRDSPDERGAQTHRFRVEMIDPKRGGATAYVVKYIAKNIDGEGVGTDRESGREAREAAQRVEAWASTHGIRQFQFSGCPPVGVWRELRRIPEDAINDAPEMLRGAWHAAQREGDKLADFGHFFSAQGRPGTPRSALCNQLIKAPCQRVGRYGEALEPRTIGVRCEGFVALSDRKVWTIQRRPHAPRRGSFVEAQRRPRDPRTCVNNCTPHDAACDSQRSHAHSGSDFATDFSTTARRRRSPPGNGPPPPNIGLDQHGKPGNLVVSVDALSIPRN